jgi:hypothetical protein
MNAFNKNSFRQKLFKCAVMIVILLQAACAANVGMLGGGPNDWTAPKPAKLAANGASTAFICRMDMPGEVSARPKAQPTTAIHFPQPITEEKWYEPLVDENIVRIYEASVALIWAVTILIALSRCDG